MEYPAHSESSCTNNTFNDEVIELSDTSDDSSDIDIKYEPIYSEVMESLSLKNINLSSDVSLIKKSPNFSSAHKGNMNAEGCTKKMPATSKMIIDGKEVTCMLLKIPQSNGIEMSPENSKQELTSSANPSRDLKVSCFKCRKPVTIKEFKQHVDSCTPKHHHVPKRSRPNSSASQHSPENRSITKIRQSAKSSLPDTSINEVMQKMPSKNMVVSNNSEKEKSSVPTRLCSSGSLLILEKPQTISRSRSPSFTFTRAEKEPSADIAIHADKNISGTNRRRDSLPRTSRSNKDLSSRVDSDFRDPSPSIPSKKVETTKKRISSQTSKVNLSYDEDWIVSNPSIESSSPQSLAATVGPLPSTTTTTKPPLAEVISNKNKNISNTNQKSMPLPVRISEYFSTAENEFACPTENGRSCTQTQQNPTLSITEVIPLADVNDEENICRTNQQHNYLPNAGELSYCQDLMISNCNSSQDQQCRKETLERLPLTITTKAPLAEVAVRKNNNISDINQSSSSSSRKCSEDISSGENQVECLSTIRTEADEDENISGINHRSSSLSRRSSGDVSSSSMDSNASTIINNLEFENGRSRIQSQQHPNEILEGLSTIRTEVSPLAKNVSKIKPKSSSSQCMLSQQRLECLSTIKTEAEEDENIFGINHSSSSLSRRSSGDVSSSSMDSNASTIVNNLEFENGQSRIQNRQRSKEILEGLSTIKTEVLPIAENVSEIKSKSSSSQRRDSSNENLFSEEYWMVYEPNSNTGIKSKSCDEKADIVISDVILNDRKDFSVILEGGNSEGVDTYARNKEDDFLANLELVSVNSTDRYYAKHSNITSSENFESDVKFKDSSIEACDEPASLDQNSEGNLDSSLLENSTLSCFLCSFTTNNKKSLLSHEGNHGNASLTLFRCVYCNQKYTKPGLRSHMDDVHPGQKFQFAKEIHESIHNTSNISKNKTFKCNNCEFSASRKGLLTEHVMRKICENKFSCPRCSYVGRTPGHMYRHQKSHKSSGMIFCHWCDFKSTPMAVWYHKFKCEAYLSIMIGEPSKSAHEIVPVVDKVAQDNEANFTSENRRKSVYRELEPMTKELSIEVNRVLIEHPKVSDACSLKSQQTMNKHLSQLQGYESVGAGSDAGNTNVNEDRFPLFTSKNIDENDYASQSSFALENSSISSEVGNESILLEENSKTDLKYSRNVLKKNKRFFSVFRKGGFCISKTNRNERMKRANMKCPQCSWRTANNKNLKVHLSTHKLHENMSCAWCEFKSTPQAFSHHQNKCKARKLMVGSSKRSKNASSSARIKQKSKTKCPLCSYKSKHLGQLKSHLVTHIRFRNVSCLWCQYKSTPYVVGRHQQECVARLPAAGSFKKATEALNTDAGDKEQQSGLFKSEIVEKNDNINQSSLAISSEVGNDAHVESAADVGLPTILRVHLERLPLDRNKVVDNQKSEEVSLNVARVKAVTNGKLEKQCPSCDFTSTLKMVDKHIRETGHSHAGVKCLLCSAVFSKVMYMRQHLKSHKEAVKKCPSCDFTSTSSCLAKHMRTKGHVTSPVRINQFQNNESDKQPNQEGLEFQTNLKLQLENVHPEQNIKPVQNDWDRPTQTGYSLKKINCNLCSAVLLSESRLKQHLATHKGPIKKCHQCNFKSTRSYLERHIQVKGHYKILKRRRQKSKIQRNPNPPSDESAKQLNLKSSNFRCDLCSFSADLAIQLKKHKKNAHPEQNKVDRNPAQIGSERPTGTVDNSRGKIKCKLCSAVILSESRLKQHLATHKGPIKKCHQCNFKSTRTYLERHIKVKGHYRTSKHRVQKNKILLSEESAKQLNLKSSSNFRCDLCSFSTDLAVQLKIHHRDAHPAQNENEVDRNLAQVKSERPTGTVDNSRGKINCNLCSAVLLSESRLKQHLAAHKGALKKCHRCNFKSTQKYLQKHIHAKGHYKLPKRRMRKKPNGLANQPRDVGGLEVSLSARVKEELNEHKIIAHSEQNASPNPVVLASGHLKQEENDFDFESTPTHLANPMPHKKHSNTSITENNGPTNKIELSPGGSQSSLKFQCHLCPFSFHLRIQLNVHIRKVHAQQNEASELTS